jgi:two-component system, OmpR family, response regulator QseB
VLKPTEHHFKNFSNKTAARRFFYCEKFMKILLVEDDSMLGASLRRGLTDGGHTVDWLRDGALAEAALKVQNFDIVLLDLTLPSRDGLAILRQLRERRQTLPVIILTARGDIADRVVGLDLGADDYLAKPFALAELEARIRALTRRAGGHVDTILQCGELQLNPATKEVSFRGGLIILTSREYQILAALIRRPGAILAKAQLTEQIYDWDTEIDSNAVEVHIHRLRQKLAPELIRTVRGLGYQLVSQ